MEQPTTIREIAKMAGLSEEFVRAACHRSAGNHRLPHTRSGEKRAVIRIRPSVFERWYAEEEMRG